jgi:hypothetical protein
MNAQGMFAHDPGLESDHEACALLNRATSPAALHMAVQMGLSGDDISYDRTHTHPINGKTVTVRVSMSVRITVKPEGSAP